MTTNNEFLLSLPEHYHEIREYVELSKVYEQVFGQAKQKIDRLFDDQFVMTGSATSIQRRERMLRIQADPARESLQFRKKRIVNRLSIKAPFTERYLQQRIDYLFGIGRGRINVDVQNFILTLSASMQDALIFKEAQQTIEKIKPANMEYVATPWTRETILIQDRATVKQWRYHKVHEFRVGMTPLKYKKEVVL